MGGSVCFDLSPSDFPQDHSEQPETKSTEFGLIVDAQGIRHAC